ncbi:hypothetical protein [Sulfitobacter pontiacus]|uniref:hypothetical protein n=2 Tax=Sulfitobacter pontiacus TaxID=60137 RepID=UPI0030EF13F2
MDGSLMAMQRKGRNAVSRFMPPRIKSVSRSLGYCLLLDDLDAWLGVATVLKARLSPSERAALAYVALRAMHPHDAESVAVAALGVVSAPQAGQPVAPLISCMDEAAFWADMATPDEREAYCLASFKAMPYERQCAFLDFVHGRQAA